MILLNLIQFGLLSMYNKYHGQVIINGSMNGSVWAILIFILICVYISFYIFVSKNFYTKDGINIFPLGLIFKRMIHTRIPLNEIF